MSSAQRASLRATKPNVLRLLARALRTAECTR